MYTKFFITLRYYKRKWSIIFSWILSYFKYLNLSVMEDKAIRILSYVFTRNQWKLQEEDVYRKWSRQCPLPILWAFDVTKNGTIKLTFTQQIVWKKFREIKEDFISIQCMPYQAIYYTSYQAKTPINRYKLIFCHQAS